MATESRSGAGLLKIKTSAVQDGPLKAKFDSSASNKRNESSSKESVGAKYKSNSIVTKTEAKLKTTPTSKTAPSSSKTATKTAATKVRQKKVYSLPGQKYDPPEEREPLRIFYESLSKQIPSSEMAEFWMMEHGMLSPERAKRAYEKKQRKQKQIRMGTPVKSPNTPCKPESSQKHLTSKNGNMKAKKRIIQESDDDDDLIFKRRKL